MDFAFTEDVMVARRYPGLSNLFARAAVTNRTIVLTAFIVYFCIICGCADRPRFDNSILWSVEHPVTGARSYVMGTIHHMDTNHITLPLDQIAALIAETDFLCLEVKLSEAGQQPAEFAKAMFVSDTTQNVMNALDEADQVKLLDLLQSGSQADVVPWELVLPRLKPQAINLFLLMGNQQSSPLFQEGNFSPEAHFKRYASAKGIDVIAFEKRDDQQRWLIRDIPFADGVEQLKASIDYFAANDAEHIDIYSRYQQQNLMLLPTEVYMDSIMVMRNRNMVLQADSLMQDKTLFIIVGAAHLPFSTGILYLLQERGYKVRPVETAIALQ